MAYDLDPAVAQASWRLPQTTVHFDDVVGRDLAGLAYDETAVEVGLVGGEAQRSSLLPALSRRVASERFVGRVIVVLQVVTQTQGQGLVVGIDLGGPVQGAQDLIVGGAVEALDDAVTLGVFRLAVDDPGTQSPPSTTAKVSVEMKPAP